MMDSAQIDKTLTRLRALHVGNPRDDSFLEHLNRLLRRSPTGDLLPEAVRFTNTGETRGIMVVSGPGGGKSTMLQRGLSRHPAFANCSDDKRPYIGATVPSPASLKSMSDQLLTESGYPSVSKYREVWSRWGILRERFMLLKTAVLWIDEAHDLFCADRNLILRAIKSLMQGESAVIVILSGTEKLAEFIRSDPQVQRRFSTLVLPLADAVMDRDDILTIIDAHCEIARLAAPDPSDLVDRLVHAARHRFGLCIEYSIAAVEQALLQGADRLELHHFAAAWSLLEGNEIARNVFLADDWSKIDPDRLRDIELADARSRRRRAK